MTIESNKLKAGDKVRLIANPSRVGTLTDESDGPVGRPRILVRFDDGSDQFILIGALEKVEQSLGPFSEINAGRYGGATDLRGLMTYYRLSGKLANLIYSLNTTNTQFLAYQFKPVLNFLASPCNGILIADEVGLGKTIEAGLIWTELRARQEAKRLLIVCPSMLREKWQLELSNRFGVKANLVDAGELLTHLTSARERPYESFALITSIQGIRPAKGWNDVEEPSKKTSAKLARFLDEVDFEDALLDMVVIDEAHYLRNRETQTYQLGELLRPVTQNLILLSATPIQMRNTDLYNLLHLLDENAFPYEFSFEQTLRSNAPIVHLRDMVLNSPISQSEFINALQDALNSRFFDDNEQIEFLLNNPPTDEYLTSPSGRAELAERLDRINPLAKVVTRTLKRDVQEMRVQRMPVPIKVKMTDIERDFYDAVTSEVRDYCDNLEISAGFMLTGPQRQMSSCMAAACLGWSNKINESSSEEVEEFIYESYGYEVQKPKTPPKLGPLLHALVGIAKDLGNYAALSECDSKYNELYRNLRMYWGRNPGKKIVLFSFYRHTLYYLAKRLKAEGVASVVVHGGMDKNEALHYFASQEGPNILLSSEVASEGVDLQFSSLLINYDLPWNPMKIEQRIGRIDRIGQEAEQILIWNFIYEDTIDERVYDRLLARLNIFKQALGSIEAILGDESHKLHYELLSHKLTPEQEIERINRGFVAIETNDRQQKQLESDATQLIAHGEFIQNKVRAARDLGRFISGEDLLAYVKDYLVREFEGTRFIQSGGNPLEVQVNLSIEANNKFREFVSVRRLESSTNLLLSHPPKMLFENQLGKTLQGVERVTQEHPIVRFVAELMKSKNKGVYHPVSAIELPAHLAPGFNAGNYVYAISRWSVSGSREIERLEYVVFDIERQQPVFGDAAEHLVSIAAMSGNDWLAHRTLLNHPHVAELFDQCRDLLEIRFKNFSDDCMREDRDRINLMLNMLQHHLDAQKVKINERINTYKYGSDKQRRMIPAEEGRLRKLSRKMEERMAELKLKERAESFDSFVSGGTIHLI